MGVESAWAGGVGPLAQAFYRRWRMRPLELHSPTSLKSQLERQWGILLQDLEVLSKL